MISKVKIVVDAGPQFAFSTAKVSPLAAGTVLPKGFAKGQPAESGVVISAASAGLKAFAFNIV